MTLGLDYESFLSKAPYVKLHRQETSLFYLNFQQFLPRTKLKYAQIQTNQLLELFFDDLQRKEYVQRYLIEQFQTDFEMY